jgi:hypothetical protein
MNNNTMKVIPSTQFEFISCLPVINLISDKSYIKAQYVGCIFLLIIQFYSSLFSFSLLLYIFFSPCEFGYTKKKKMSKVFLTKDQLMAHLVRKYH